MPSDDMSQAGVVAEGLERSASIGSLKRKRESHSRASPSEIAKSVKLNGDHGNSLTDVQASKRYRSPDSDEDPVRGVGSASSASSVFSNNANAFAHNRKASLANGLTPLTDLTNTDSSPLKGNSPQNQISSIDMASTNGVLATSHVPASDITLEPTTSRTERPQMLPPPGKAKGYRVVWDPELDNKLSKEERKRATPRRKEFGTEVRHIFHNHNLLSLRKIMIYIT